MRRFSTFVCLALLLLLLRVASKPILAEDYRVAHQSDGFTSFEHAVINNSGVVVFSALRRHPTTGKIMRGVYKGRGGNVQVVAEAPAFEARAPRSIAPQGGAAIGINHSGLVSFTAFTDFGALVFVTAGAVRAEDVVGSLGNGGFLPTVPGNGYIAFGTRIWLFPRDESARIRDCDSCRGLGRPNSRQQYIHNGSGNDISIVTYATVTRPDDGSYILPIRTNVVATISEAARIAGGSVAGTLALLNDNGVLAFYNLPANGIAGIYISANTPFVENRDGSEFTFNGVPQFSFNNNNEIAFQAHSRTWGKVGIFRGRSAIADKVVLPGDVVAGSRMVTVNQPMRFIDRWFNDNGQVLFFGTDANGAGLWVTSGIQTTPPATTLVEWVAPASSVVESFGDPSNWKPLNNDPARVPEKNVTFNDGSLFDRPGEHRVSVGAQYNDRLIVRDTALRLENGSLKVDNLSLTDPSLLVDNADLYLESGFTLTNNSALIGKTGEGEVKAQSGSIWKTLGSLRVGGAGLGILTAAAGAQVESAEARVGAGPAGGSVSLASGAKWYTGNLAVGAGGPGMILNSGELLSDLAIIGFEGGPNNFVSILGSTAGSSRATWHLVGATVGDRGEGWLGAILGGSINAEAYLQIAARNGSRGEVLVDGFQNNKSSDLIASQLIVGKQGSGTLVITNGGSVTAGQMQIGPVPGSKGIVRVDGVYTDASSEVPSSLHVEGDLQIGWNGASGFGIGDMIIRDGASVMVDGDALLQCGLVSGQSSILVGGADSTFEVGATLYVGHADSSGKCALILEGSVVRAGEVWVLQHGEIRGIGTLDVPIGARLVSDGGFISPGLSPGVLNINGAFEQRSRGRLLIELGGTNSTAHDQLVVAGEANLDGEVIFRLVNGFTPRAGDRFDFLKVGGARNGSFAKVSFQNVAPGFQFSLSESGTNYGIAALNDAVYDATLPGTVDIAVTNLGGITYATCTTRTGSACEEIALDGPFTRFGNTFQQTFQGTRVLNVGCPAEEQVVTEVLVLGALSPGEYSFETVVDGATVKSIPFTVTGGKAPTLLNSIRLADGSVQFDIAGLAPVKYSLEVSDDLKTWDTLTEGTLPATVFDPGAVILPARYYRAVIRR